MDVEDVNMEQFNVISLLGADAQLHSRTTDLAKAREELNRKTVRLHMRHAFSWLLRGAVVAGLFLAGQFAVEGTVGGAMAWTSGFLAIYLFWYAAKGHLTVQNDRQAKLYWLEDDAGKQVFASRETFVATMMSQEAMEPARCYSKVAS